MPAENGYELRVAPGGAANGAVQASPEAFGAGIGAGIAQLGNTLEGAALQHYRIQRQQQADQQASDFAAKFAALRQQADKVSTDARTNAAPGGAGHAAAMEDWWKTSTAGLLDGISEDAVRRRAAESLAGFGASFNSREYDWQAATGSAKIVTDTQATIDTAANRVRTSSDPTALAQELHATLGSIEAMSGVPADVRDKLHRATEQSLSVAQIDGMLDRGQVLPAKALVDSGAFDAILSPEQLDRARRGIRVGESQARAAAGVAVAQQKQANATELATLQQGRATPEQWNSLAAKMEAVGDGDGAVRARGEATAVAAAEGHRGDSLAERQALIDQLKAKPQLSAAEGATLKGVEGQQRYVEKLPAISRLTYATGQAVAPIDWTDPSSIATRIHVVGAARSQFGGEAQPLLPAEAETLSVQAKGNRDDRIAAMHNLLALGPYARQALDQVAPTDREFRSSMALAALPRGGELVDIALRGIETAKAVPQMFEPAKDRTGHRGPTLEQIVTADTAQAMALLPGEYRQSLIDNTKALYAGYYGQKGLTALDPAGVRRALFFAQGGQQTSKGQTGGVGSWRGYPTMLPNGMSQAELDRRLSRATVDEWHAAQVSGAPWVPSQNRTMSTGELRGATIVAKGDGIYAVRNPDNSFVFQRDGRTPYLFDVRRMRGLGEPPAPAARAPAHQQGQAATAASL